MYELTVIIGKGSVIVGTARGWHLFMEEGFGDGGGGVVYVSSQFQNFRQFFVTILKNSVSNFIIDMTIVIFFNRSNSQYKKHISYRESYIYFLFESFSEYLAR